MNKKVNIAIDAMGGDNSPRKVIEGINISLKNNKDNFFILFGDKNSLKEEIKKNKIPEEIYEIINTKDKILYPRVHQ